MPVLGHGAAELRVRDSAGIYRVFYYTAAAGRVFVFHAFVKTTQTTPQSEIKLGVRRLKELLG
jgi:phage-related protein